jgi:hypothetical protein
MFAGLLDRKAILCRMSLNFQPLFHMNSKLPDLLVLLCYLVTSPVRRGKWRSCQTYPVYTAQAAGEAKRDPRKTAEKKQGALEGRRTISSEVAPPGLLVKQDLVPGVPLRFTPGCLIRRSAACAASPAAIWHVCYHHRLSQQLKLLLHSRVA